MLAICLMLFAELVLHGSDAFGAWNVNSSASGSAHHPIQQILAQAAQRALTVGTVNEASPASVESGTQICAGCNHSNPGGFVMSPSFSAIPLLDREAARSLFQHSRQQAGGALLKRFLVQNIPLAATFSKAWMSSEQQNIMLNSYLTAPDQLLSYSFVGLQLDRPTAYLYTRTRGGEPYSAAQLAYFQAHHDTIKQHMVNVERDGYTDGSKADERQLLYIIVRDDSRLDSKVESFFKQRNIRECALPSIVGSLVLIRPFSTCHVGASAFVSGSKPISILPLVQHATAALCSGMPWKGQLRS